MSTNESRPSTETDGGRCPRCGKKWYTIKKFPVPDPRDVPAVLRPFKLYRENGRLVARWPDLLPAWQHAYPHVDIPRVLEQAHIWLVCNKGKAKYPRSNFASFLSRWMAREQDKTQGYAPAKNPPLTIRMELLLELSQYRGHAIIFHRTLWTIRREGLWRQNVGVRLWNEVTDDQMREIILRAKGR